MNKSGIINLESILAIVITLMLILTGVAAYSYYVGKISNTAQQENIVNKYTKLLISIREDALMAAKANIEENKFTLIDKSDKTIASYMFENGIFTRIANNPEIAPKNFLSNVKEVKFWLNAKYPNLLSVELTTQNDDDIPFFTSFALRCYKNE